MSIFREMRAVLSVLADDEVSAITIAVSYWSICFDVTAICFVANFSEVEEFQKALTVIPAFIGMASSLLMLSAGLILSVRSPRLPWVRKAWVALVSGSLVILLINLIIQTISNAALMSVNTGEDRQQEPPAGSATDVNLIVYSVGAISVAYHWTHFLFLFGVMLYLFSRGGYSAVLVNRGKSYKK